MDISKVEYSAQVLSVEVSWLPPAPVTCPRHPTLPPPSPSPFPARTQPAPSPAPAALHHPNPAPFPPLLSLTPPPIPPPIPTPMPKPTLPPMPPPPPTPPATILYVPLVLGFRLWRIKPGKSWPNSFRWWRRFQTPRRDKCYKTFYGRTFQIFKIS